jgi:hypothetical protein
MESDVFIVGIALIIYVGGMWVKWWLWKRENEDKP